jgi:hypothetical protein
MADAVADNARQKHNQDKDGKQGAGQKEEMAIRSFSLRRRRCRRAGVVVSAGGCFWIIRVSSPVF